MSLRIAVLVSGSGTNLQNIINQCQAGYLQSKVELVIADRPCYALDRAKQAHIECHCLKRNEVLSEKINRILLEKGIDLIVLAGFLSILSTEFCASWQQKIINVHPSLLPKYGGKNMYGDRVHSAVLANKEEKSGATVHYVTEVVDGGRIILQKEVSIAGRETIASLRQKVQQVEYDILVEGIKKIENERPKHLKG